MGLVVHSILERLFAWQPFNDRFNKTCRRTPLPQRLDLCASSLDRDVNQSFWQEMIIPLFPSQGNPRESLDEIPSWKKILPWRFNGCQKTIPAPPTFRYPFRIGSASPGRGLGLNNSDLGGRSLIRAVPPTPASPPRRRGGGLILILGRSLFPRGSLTTVRNLP